MPGERPRTEGSKGAPAVNPGGIWGGLDLFITSLYLVGRILVPGAVRPPPAPDVPCEMMKPVCFPPPAKDEAAMAGKRLQSLSLNK